jgi:hypothetical protein
VVAEDLIRRSGNTGASPYTIRSTSNLISERPFLSFEPSAITLVSVESFCSLILQSQHTATLVVVTVHGHQIVGPIQIVGEGEVVRVERTRPEQDLRAGVRASSQPRELQSRW